MGYGHFTSKDFADYARSRSYGSRSADEVVNRSHVEPDFLPPNFRGPRESRDSDDNPRSTAIIIAGDVTGSMGQLAGLLIKSGLARFAEQVYERRPVSDPHIMGMAIGDAAYDHAPIQATQFEADIRIVQQFEQLYVEGGGGGNDSESYHLPWLVAAGLTSIDCWDRRREKGVLFTYGDEESPQPLTSEECRRCLGTTLPRGMTEITARQALDAVSQRWDVYHLIIEEGDYARRSPDRVLRSWTRLLGQRAIRVADHRKLPEIMVSILQMRGGADASAVRSSWDDATARVVGRAVAALPASR